MSNLLKLSWEEHHLWFCIEDVEKWSFEAIFSQPSMLVLMLCLAGPPEASWLDHEWSPDEVEIQFESVNQSNQSRSSPVQMKSVYYDLHWLSKQKHLEYVVEAPCTVPRCLLQLYSKMNKTLHDTPLLLEQVESLRPAPAGSWWCVAWLLVKRDLTRKCARVKAERVAYRDELTIPTFICSAMWKPVKLM